ncbi:MAG TPA: rod shape-determining protein RodA [Oligoflexia bacterium]|nr:rod shape-determining protein RodA [Oligoflexia bacterium]HMP48668.1 rod shape-determining protein RodA [Oligoflexia bacterium]
MPLINKRIISNFDWLLVLFTLILGLIGLIVLGSAGYDPDEDKSAALNSQAIYLVGSWFLFFIATAIGPNGWKRLSIPVYIVGIILLLYIIFKGGIVAGGARRWISLGFVRMQPSEIMKLGLILVLSRYFSNYRDTQKGYHLRNMGIPLLLIIFPAALILKQPDLGTALCLIAIGMSMLFIAGLRFSTILKLSIPVVILTIPAWHFGLKDYQKQRVLTFLAPEQDPLGKGYHAIQSKIAVGSGAVFGKGYRKGTQTQLRFLPEQNTDFIFSVLAEEWGFVGSVVVLSLYGMLLMHLLSVASKMADSFSMYVTIGTAALIFWHVFINIGMVIGVLPVVGITLVLLSYGGSSLLTCMILLGIVTGLSARRYMFA